MMIPQYNTALAKSTVGMEPDAMELMVEFEWAAESGAAGKGAAAR